MFKRLERGGPTVRFRFEDEEIEAVEGESVAAALLAAGIDTFRTSPLGPARAPYCMIGMCFDCLVSIDGVENRRACQVAVAPGLSVRRQSGARRVG
ncbi:(2Fe-2S)-binding protein [Acuticoccus mangrovi]|uniref:(2Fe-2S)-binding protein n=1 Tax=Acuticoccus mangrovi TaxID=2796142 RepID=A0A934INW1_9HYPH|nr:(2Fe-2S)-binding protein [Acuticoccus mangrovi]MBJ3775642.1 (2Fe-2S)-binding protein [Acuticoccus mangrovi]